MKTYALMSRKKKFTQILIILHTEFVIVDLPADFEVKINVKLTPNCQLREKSAKLVFIAVCAQLTLTPIFA